MKGTRVILHVLLFFSELTFLIWGKVIFIPVCHTRMKFLHMEYISIKVASLLLEHTWKIKQTKGFFKTSTACENPYIHGVCNTFALRSSMVVCGIYMQVPVNKSAPILCSRHPFYYLRTWVKPVPLHGGAETTKTKTLVSGSVVSGSHNTPYGTLYMLYPMVFPIFTVLPMEFPLTRSVLKQGKVHGSLLSLLKPNMQFTKSPNYLMYTSCLLCSGFAW